MIQLEKILFPTDFTRCADQALMHALFLARKYGAELHLLHVVVLHEDDPNNPAKQFPSTEELYKRLSSNVADELQSLGQRDDARNLRTVQVQLRDIAAAPAIIQYAHEEDLDLIVIGTHGRRGLKHLLLGSVAEEVVRTAYRPVMTIREKPEMQKIEAVENILVPIDFSKYSRESLIYAKELARSYDARLQLLHIVEESMHPAFYNTGVTSIYDVVPDIDEKARHSLLKMLDVTPGPNVPAEIYIRKGRASKDIVKFAETNNTDLIVIATHGLTGIEHLLLGSVTEKVVRMAGCPVFTVKAFGKSLVQSHALTENPELELH